MWKSLLIVLFLAFGCASSKERLSQKEKKALIYYKEGTSELYNQNYTLALQHLLNADELKPNDTRILNNLGMAYFFKKQNKLAIKNIKNSIKINPENTQAKLNLATIYMRTGKLNQALAMYKDILKVLVYMEQFKTHYNIGLIYLKQNKIEMAKKEFAKSAEVLDSYCPAHFKLGELYYEQGDFQKSYRSFYKASKGTCYQKPAPHYWQAMALIQLERYADAKSKFEIVLGKFGGTDFARKSRRKMLSISPLVENDVKSEFSVESRLRKNLYNEGF